MANNEISKAVRMQKLFRFLHGVKEGAGSRKRPEKRGPDASIKGANSFRFYYVKKNFNEVRRGFGTRVQHLGMKGPCDGRLSN